MKDAKEKRVEYALYAMLFVALIMCLYFIIISSSLSQRILACSLAVTIIIGGFVNVWKIFHSSDKLDNVSDGLVSVSNKLDELKVELVELKKEEVIQTKDIEAQRRKDEREPLIRSLKRELKEFISFWENNREKILKNGQNLNMEQLNNIRAIGKKSEERNLDRGMFLSENIEDEANEIIKGIKDFSMRIRVNVKTVGNDEVDTKRNQIIVKDGDILTKRVKEIIKKI